MKDKVIEIILEEIKEMKSDIKELLKFKYQMLAMVTLGSVIISFVVSLFFK